MRNLSGRLEQNQTPFGIRRLHAAAAGFLGAADAWADAATEAHEAYDRGTRAYRKGDYATARLADLTADAGAALDYLRNRPDVDPARTGVLGHSEGGVYTASLLEAGAPIAFAVGMAAPATNGIDLLVAQNGAIVQIGRAHV